MNAQAFGKYQLLKKLATGGMAEVWLAQQTGIEGYKKDLVVKRILPHLADDPEFVQMFLNEAKIAARFSHPNIAQIFDLGEMNGAYFIAMEFVSGEDLGRVMRKAWSSGQWIARPLSIRIVAGACEGLYYAHTKADEQSRPLKVVHRDISPQNILISFDGSVKLVDFGIAKAADQASLTKSGAIKGKFAYMSPEQAAGKPLDHRSDIFSIGLVLYELLTGVRPLKRDSELATLQAALECNIEPPSKVADVPEDLDPVVMKALAKAADDRYRDARAFQMALEEFLVSQRWVASSVQLSELMQTLFADRLEEEKKLGRPAPEPHDTSAPSGSPMAPLPANERSLTDELGKSVTGDADVSWEAPPGETAVRERAAKNRHQPRTMSRPSTRAKDALTDPASRGQAEPPPDVPEWEAPSAAGIPGKRDGNSTAYARSSSRELPRTRSPESIRKPKMVIPGASEEPEAPEDGMNGHNGSVERSTGTSQRTRMPPKRPSGELRAPRSPSGEMSLPPEDVEPPRRRTKSKEAVPMPRTSSRSSVAPYKPKYADVEIPPDDVPEVGEVPADPSPIKQLPVKPLALIAGLVVLGLLMLIFHKEIGRALTHRAVDGQQVFLTVESNQPVHVLVKHQPNDGSTEPVTELGEAPLRHVPGAHVRDTIILKNEQQDIYWEDPIPYGEPGQVHRIVHDFKMGYYELNLTPDTLRDISVHLNGINGPVVAKYPPPTKFELVEGKHTLVLDGEQLIKPAEIEVEVKPKVTTKGKPYSLQILMRP